MKMDRYMDISRSKEVIRSQVHPKYGSQQVNTLLICKMETAIVAQNWALEMMNLNGIITILEDHG